MPVSASPRCTGQSSTTPTARGYVVLRCTGEETEARLSFIGLTDLIGDVVDEFAAPLPAVQVEALDLALSRRRGDADSTPDPKAAGIALRSLLVNVAAHAPVLIAIDDVGWVDDSTLHSLAFVARRVEDVPIGLLTTLRIPAENIDPIRLDRALGPDRSHRISLGPLDEDATMRVIEERFPGRFVPPVLRRIATASGGNPLFALDIARSLDPSMPLEAGDPLPVPEQPARLGRLPDRLACPKRRARRCSPPRPCSTRRLQSSNRRRPKPDSPRARRRKSSASNAAEWCSPIRSTRRPCTAVRRPTAGGRCTVGSPNLVGDSEERARHRALGATSPDEEVAVELTDAAQKARARGAWDSAAELMEQAQQLDARGRPRRRRVAVASQPPSFMSSPATYAGRRRFSNGFLGDVPAGDARSDGLRLLGEILYDNDSYADAAVVLEEAAPRPTTDVLAAKIQPQVGVREGATR